MIQDIFFKSLVVGLVVAILAIIFDATTENLILFSCLAASAAILVHHHEHSKTTLRVALEGYVIAGIIAILILYITTFFSLTYFPLKVFLALTLSTFFMYLFNSFHPPAIASAFAFIVFEQSIFQLLIILLAVLFLLTLVKISFYLRHPKLSFKDFYKELFTKHSNK